MHKPVEMSCRLLNLFTDLILTVKIEHVGYQFECILVVLDFGVETGQIESIRKVFFVDLAKVLITARVDKLSSKTMSAKMVTSNA